MFGQLKPLQCLNVKAKKKTALETAENKQKDEKLIGGSKVLVYFDVKHVFTAAAKGSIRETQLTGRVPGTIDPQTLPGNNGSRKPLSLFARRNHGRTCKLKKTVHTHFSGEAFKGQRHGFYG